MADAPLHITAEAGMQTSESQIEPEAGYRLTRTSTGAETTINRNMPALAASTAQSLQGTIAPLSD